MGKIAVVTGANTGIGKEIARGLAAQGMSVVLACRNAERAEAARRDGVPVRPPMLEPAQRSMIRQLERAGDLEEVGGPAYIASLADGVTEIVTHPGTSADEELR